jgi:predicted ribosome quality control (RQC) complex YloA/Tae2 family protein
LEFRVLKKEIASALSGTYVSNIYSIGESQLLRLRKPSLPDHETAEVSLVLSPKLGVWLTARPSRVETTEFTTSLRSHLLRARLVAVTQVDLDRVLILEFESKAEGGGKMSLALEMMPPGNIVLVGHDGRVVIALREVRTESRRIVRGGGYNAPAQNRASIETLTAEDLRKALEREPSLGRALGRGLSIPRRYVDEILARTALRQDDRSGASQEEIQKLMIAIGSLLHDVNERPAPCIVDSADGPVEVMVTHPIGKRILDSSPTLSPLVDGLLFDSLIDQGEKAEGGAGRGGEDPARRRAEELEATIQNLSRKKEGLSNVASDLRVLAQRMKEAGGIEAAVAIAKGSKSVPKDVLMSLDSKAEKGQASLSSMVFDGAKRAELEIHDIDVAIAGLEAKLKRERGRELAPRSRTVSLSRAKKEWYEKFRWFFTTGGKLAIGGRDAQSNTMLVRRHLQEGDTVFHADLFGSPFFVLKGGKAQSEEEVREVAKATVSFSSAWKTGLGAADAYWVNPDQVSSAGPSGEYLAHGSFAIRGKKNFVTKNPVEVAVGVDEGGRVISGPEEAVMKSAIAHVAIVPSRDKASDTAKKVAHELETEANPAVRLTVDDVLRMLPAGGGKIIRRRLDRRPTAPSAPA